MRRAHRRDGRSHGHEKKRQAAGPKIERLFPSSFDAFVWSDDIAIVRFEHAHSNERSLVLEHFAKYGSVRLGRIAAQPLAFRDRILQTLTEEQRFGATLTANYGLFIGGQVWFHTGNGLQHGWAGGVFNVGTMLLMNSFDDVVEMNARLVIQSWDQLVGRAHFARLGKIFEALLASSRPHPGYAILGVAPAASDDDLRKAYKQKSLEHHPDRNPGQAHSAARFMAVQTAYNEITKLRKPRG